MAIKITGIHTSGAKMFDIDKFVMPQIPTLFKRDPATKLVLPELTDDCEWVLEGKGLLTIKIDGVQVKIKANTTGKLKPYKLVKGYSQPAYAVVNEKDSVDKPIWEAFENLLNKEVGFYEAYGPGIKGNPQNAERNLMIKIIPVGGAILVSNNFHLKINRGPGTTVTQFYDSVRTELAESPEIEGIVFHLEQPTMCPIKFAKIKKKDFGLLWPPTKTTQPIQTLVM